MEKPYFCRKDVTNLISMWTNIILLALSILPAILLMIYVYAKDKYQKEPFKSLAKAFFGGILAIIITLVLDGIIDHFCSNMTGLAETAFYTAFFQAGIPEEFSKFLIFMIFIWRDKNFDEYFDGIVYASFISLGFACLENILYVFGSYEQSLFKGIATGVARALLSVPGHFLFGVIMGYFLSMAKFNKGKRLRYILAGLLLAIVAHGLFDWILMFNSSLNDVTSSIIYVAFLAGDVFLWRQGLKLIRKHQQNSLLQSQEVHEPVEDAYKPIDWNAGSKQ